MQPQELDPEAEEWLIKSDNSAGWAKSAVRIQSLAERQTAASRIDFLANGAQPCLISCGSCLSVALYLMFGMQLLRCIDMIFG